LTISPGRCLGQFESDYTLITPTRRRGILWTYSDRICHDSQSKEGSFYGVGCPVHILFRAVLTRRNLLYKLRWRKKGKKTTTQDTFTPVMSCHTGLSQWCRSVVKYGSQGQSGQAIKLFQAPRKNSFTFHI